MRAAIFISAFIFLNATYSQWFAQNSGTINELKSVYFVNSNTGFICGYYSVLKTTNGGQNWSISQIEGRHNCITFVNSNTGFVSSDSGKIYRTTNAGNSWEALNTNSNSHLTSVSFINDQLGVASGYGGVALKTTDGGSSWNVMSTGLPFVDFFSVKMTGISEYYLTGTGSYIVKTTNGGANWNAFTLNEVNPFFTIEFLNANTGFATGCCGMFLTTTNAGNNWTMNYYLSLGFTFKSLKFINNTTGFLAGDNGMIFRTTNAGAWWDSTVTGTDQNFYSVFMIDANTGWAVGNYGTILKTTNGGGTGYTIGLNQLSNEVPSEFILFQNYPNPFNPLTTIRFEIPLSRGVDAEGRQLVTPMREGVSLRIYDALGKQVSDLVNEELSPGKYEYKWDATEFPSGVYFYRIQAGDFMISRKMLLVK